MPGFVIFVLVLTFVYVVYFSVMITLDLHSKKDEKKTDEETIDVRSMPCGSFNSEAELFLLLVICVIFRLHLKSGKQASKEYIFHM